MFRAIQLANFTTPLVLDDDAQLTEALRRLPEIDADAIVAAIDSPEVVAAYEADKHETRTAAGSAAELQGKTRQHRRPGAVHARRRSCSRATARGWSPAAFSRSRRTTCWSRTSIPGSTASPPPETPEPLLERFPEGLVTQEVAALIAGNNETPDRAAAEAGLLELVAAGRATREPLGDDALWRGATDQP